MGGQRTKRGRARAALVLVALVELAGAGGAGASNFGSSGTVGASGTTNGVWLTTNATWGVRYRSLQAVTQDSTYDVVWGQFAPTHLSVSTSAASTCAAAATVDV